MIFLDFQQERLQTAEGEYNDELESITDEFDTEKYVAFLVSWY